MRFITAAAIAAFVAASCLRATQKAQVVVITSASVPAYAEALNGIRQSLGEAGPKCRVLDLEQKGAAEAFSSIQPEETALLVTLGTKAIEQVGVWGTDVPVITSMTLNADSGLPRPARPLSIRSSMFLEIPLESMLSTLKRTVPGGKRLGVIRSPSWPEYDRALEAHAVEQGYRLRVVECSTPAELLKVFFAMKGSVDFVWAVPDSSLYNSTSVKALIMSSFRDGLPIIGFSENFVRAGAVLGIYPDYRDVGRQTGELIMKFFASQKLPAANHPRTVKVAINNRAARILGVRYSAGGDAEVIVR